MLIKTLLRLPRGVDESGTVLITGFARALKVFKIAVGAGKSLKFGVNFVQPGFSSTYKEQAQKDLQDKIAHAVEELKKRHTQGFF